MMVRCPFCRRKLKPAKGGVECKRCAALFLGLILTGLLAMHGCIPAEVYAWNKSHMIPCGDDACGKATQ